MTPRKSFDDALDAAIDALVAGDSLEDVLDHHPERGELLGTLIDLAGQAASESSAATLPRPIALVHNYAIVRAAVERAQMLPRSVPAPEYERRGSWFGRRMSFASLSVPVGAVVALVFASMSGAAAASIVIEGDGGLSSSVAAYVSPHMPLVGSDGSTDSTAATAVEATRTHVVPAIAVPAGGSARASDNRPALITVTGTVSLASGNTFVLTNGQGDMPVNFDALTKVSGTIADGATATVLGAVTAEKNLHAVAVDVAPEAAGAVPATETPRAAAPASTPPATVAPRTPVSSPVGAAATPSPAPTAPGESGDHKPPDPENDGRRKP